MFEKKEEEEKKKIMFGKHLISNYAIDYYGALKNQIICFLNLHFIFTCTKFLKMQNQFKLKIEIKSIS